MLEVRINGELAFYTCPGKIQLEVAKWTLRDKLAELGAEDCHIETIKGDGFIDVRTSPKDCLNPS